MAFEPLDNFYQQFSSLQGGKILTLRFFTNFITNSGHRSLISYLNQFLNIGLFALQTFKANLKLALLLSRMSFAENMAESCQELLLSMDTSSPPGKVLVNGSTVVLAESFNHFRD
jgi:hypothetical protein